MGGVSLAGGRPRCPRQWRQGGGVVFAPGVRVLPWRSAEGRQGNPTAGSSTGGRRIQTGRAAGVPRLLRKAARFVGGADSGDPGSRPGGGGTALRCLEWESVCTSVCVRGACLGLGEQGKREKSSKQAEVFGLFKVMLCLGRPDHCLPRPGFFWEAGSECSSSINSPFAKGVGCKGVGRDLEGNSPERGGGIRK